MYGFKSILMIEQSWLTITALCALAGLCALVGRLILKAWSLRQLKTLSRESLAIRRCWALLDQLPTELLTQPLRMTFGKIMYVRLKRAQKVRPEHPFLRDQQLQIAQLIGGHFDGEHQQRQQRQNPVDSHENLSCSMANIALFL